MLVRMTNMGAVSILVLLGGAWGAGCESGGTKGIDRHEAWREPGGSGGERLAGEYGRGMMPVDDREVTDEEVREFSKVQVELIEFQEGLHRRVEAGEDPHALEMELQQRALELMDESALSIERFQSIAHELREDAELRHRIEQEMIQQLHP